MSDVIDADAALGAKLWAPPVLGEAKPPKGKAGPVSVGQLDAVERAAHAEGFQQGRAEGYVQGRAEALRHAEELKQILARFARPLADLDSEIEHILVHLSNAVVASLLRGLAVHKPEMVAALVKQALAGLPTAARDVEIQLHPEDMNAVETLLPEREPKSRLVPNPQLARGDVRVHCDSVRLDATLATRLANAAEALLERPL